MRFCIEHFAEGSFHEGGYLVVGALPSLPIPWPTPAVEDASTGSVEPPQRQSLRSAGTVPETPPVLRAKRKRAAPLQAADPVAVMASARMFKERRILDEQPATIVTDVEDPPAPPTFTDGLPAPHIRHDELDPNTLRGIFGWASFRCVVALFWLLD